MLKKYERWEKHNTKENVCTHQLHSLSHKQTMKPRNLDFTGFSNDHAPTHTPGTQCLVGENLETKKDKKGEEKGGKGWWQAVEEATEFSRTNTIQSTTLQEITRALIFLDNCFRHVIIVHRHHYFTVHMSSHRATLSFKTVTTVL